MGRRTKIIATIGPASSSPDTLRSMIAAGMDVARIGLAHGSLSEAIERCRRVRAIAAEQRRHVGILVDLPGPKVRLAALPEDGVEVHAGQTMRVEPGRSASGPTALGVDYEGLLDDVHPGDCLTIGDGAVALQVESIDGDGLKATVLSSGVLRGRPGIHIPSDRLSMTSPTAEDIYQLDAFVEEGADMVALSFVRSAHDVRRVGTEPPPRGPMIIAKIETRAAVENLEGIVAASGAIMVARGDLGIELGIEDLPHLQKRIIGECIALGRPVITATQMLESMVSAPSPTRAEVSDIANAIFDGTSAVMLSGETAIGVDPVNAVATMARISARADAEFDEAAWSKRLETLRRRNAPDSDLAITDAMTGAAWRAATEMGASAIVCISNTGFTVRSIARFRPAMPIIAFSPSQRTVNQLALSWGTEPVLTSAQVDSIDGMNEMVVDAAARGYIRRGDTVAVLAGAGRGDASSARATDLLRLVRVP